jgi:hypothetical protein
VLIQRCRANPARRQLQALSSLQLGKQAHKSEEGGKYFSRFFRLSNGSSRAGDVPDPNLNRIGITTAFPATAPGGLSTLGQTICSTY